MSSNHPAGKSLSGKTALVTGASRGLGQQVALRLAAAGAHVAIVARSQAGLQETARKIESAGGRVAVFGADVQDSGHVDRLREHVAEQCGDPSILVNAAGVFGPIQLIKDTNPQRWIETLMINTIGPYLTCRAFAGGMIASGWGRIVNFSSAAALHTPGPLNSAYGTSKVALNQLTRHLATELSGTGVTANVIHPGDVKTEMWAAIRDEASKLGPEADGYRKWVHWVDETGGDDPAKAADLVLRLTSDDAASINGQFLWIENPLQAPIPSWTTVNVDTPWRK